MTSVDDLFRKPNAPPTITTKRKLDPTSTTSYQGQRSHKAAKISNGTSPHFASRNGSADLAKDPKKAAQVEDQAEDVDDISAGPSPPPPDDDGGDGSDDDEEGRFFGGGVTKQERDVLDFMDQNDGVEAEEVYDLPWLRRTALNFQRKIDKNAEMRLRYPEEPQKFVGSEADLDDEIKSLSILAEHTELYGDFAKMSDGGLESLLSLLSHENTDIAMRAVEVLAELTDEDTGAEEGQWKNLVDSSIKHGLIELMTQNLARLDEANESDRDGVYQVLALTENLCSDAENVDKIGDEGSLDLLVRRIKRMDPDARGKVSQNRQYAAEVLAILLQGSPKNRERLEILEGATDAILQILSRYQERNPEKDSDEEEFVENLFDCITCLVDDQGQQFLEAEGVDLCIRLVEKSKSGFDFSRDRALRVLDHALSGERATGMCEQFVADGGIKRTFSMLMKIKRHAERETLEHLIGILASLMRHLPGESAARIRVLAKFVEKDYEKIVKLVEIRSEYVGRVGTVEKAVMEERGTLSVTEQEDMEPEWLSRRLDAGLFALQTLDVILSWLVAEDDGARTKVTTLLGGLGVLSDSLKEQLEGIDADQAGSSTKEMLEALLVCVESYSS